MSFTDAGNPIPAADPNAPFAFVRTVPPTFCDVCGVELVNGDQVVGTGVAPTPYRHFACNAFGFREAQADVSPDTSHTRS
jgi:hypothetical protein